MLSLTVKEGDKIWIGDDIQIGVYDAKKGRVVIWIEAPQDLKILRDKLYKGKGRTSASKPQKDRTPRSADDETHEYWDQQRG